MSSWCPPVFAPKVANFPESQPARVLFCGASSRTARNYLIMFTSQHRWGMCDLSGAWTGRCSLSAFSFLTLFHVWTSTGFLLLIRLETLVDCTQHGHLLETLSSENHHVRTEPAPYPLLLHITIWNIITLTLSGWHFFSSWPWAWEWGLHFFWA